MAITPNTQRRIDVALEALHAIEQAVIADARTNRADQNAAEAWGVSTSDRIDNAVRIYCAHEVAASNYALAKP